MKKLLSLLFACSALVASASTSITAPSITGHWTLAGSPYMIFNDVSIDGSSTLTIDPGVEVVFYGAYKMTVNGNLYAAGTASQPITFHINDTTGWYMPTTAGGWSGIYFQYFGGTGSDSCSFDYCKVSDCKTNAVFINRSLKIANCDFSHISGYVINSEIDTTKSCEIANCSIHDNASLMTCFMVYGTIKIHNCSFHDNTSRLSALSVNKAILELDSNDFFLNRQTDSQNTTTIDIENSNAVLLGNRVHDNTSEFDGAISIYYSNADIVGNYICNNMSLIDMIDGSICGSTQGGGGIRLSSEMDTTDYYTYTVRNNIIANNTAMYAGGAVYIIGANVNIYNNQIVNNQATDGGGIHIFNNVSTSGHKTVKVKNNLFYGNLTTDPSYPNTQGNLDIESGDTIEYTYNWTQNPFYLDHYDFMFGYNYMLGDTGKNVTGTTPGMVSPTTVQGVAGDASLADFSLVSTSPCINKGDTAGAMPYTVDYANNARISGGKIDIGSYEYKLKNALYNPIPSGPEVSISVYPNPASNVLFVSVPSAKGTIELQDVSGKPVTEKKVTNTVTYIDIHAVPRGVYFAVWNDGGGAKVVKKIVVE